MNLFLFRFLCIIGYCKVLNAVPCAIQQGLLVRQFHFSDEETEAQRGQVTFPKSPRGGPAGLESAAGAAAPAPRCLSSSRGCAEALWGEGVSVPADGELKAEMGEVGYKLGGERRADYTGCISHIRGRCLYFEGSGEPQKGFKQGSDVMDFGSYPHPVETAGQEHNTHWTEEAGKAWRDPELADLGQAP